MKKSPVPKLSHTPVNRFVAMRDGSPPRPVDDAYTFHLNGHEFFVHRRIDIGWNLQWGCTHSATGGMVFRGSRAVGELSREEVFERAVQKLVEGWPEFLRQAAKFPKIAQP